MTGAESLIMTAEAAGIEVCFANFGTTEVSLVAAFDSIPGIRAVPALFQGVCTGAADGYARMRDKPAMVLLHLGLGLANGLANLHNAKRARTPVFTVVGDHATWHRPWDSPEATDIQGLAAPISLWVRTCVAAQTVSQDTAEGIAVALQGQPGVLIMPQDCQWGECSDQISKRTQTTSHHVDQTSIVRAAELLQKGQTSLLFLGGKALRRKGLQAAARIKAAAGCDVLAETFAARMDRGPGLLPVDRLAYFPEEAMRSLSKYDTVVLAGAAEPIATFAYKAGRSRILSDDQRVFTLDSQNVEIEEFVEALADIVASSGKGTSNDSYLPTNRPAPCQGSLTPETAARTLAALQPEGAIIVEEAITSAGPYHELAPSLPPHTLITLTGGAIGQGMPSATGAAIACPDSPVINLQGDGSTMYTAQALWTQAHEALNITTLICSNQSYDILKFEMARAGYAAFGPTSLSLTELIKPPINWTQVSKGMGVPGVTVETAEGLARELKTALREAGPHVIEMKFRR